MVQCSTPISRIREWLSLGSGPYAYCNSAMAVAAELA